MELKSLPNLRMSWICSCLIAAPWLAISARADLPSCPPVIQKDSLPAMDSQGHLCFSPILQTLHVMHLARSAAFAPLAAPHDARTFLSFIPPKSSHAGETGDLPSTPGVHLTRVNVNEEHPYYNVEFGPKNGPVLQAGGGRLVTTAPDGMRSISGVYAGSVAVGNSLTARGYVDLTDAPTLAHDQDIKIVEFQGQTTGIRLMANQIFRIKEGHDGMTFVAGGGLSTDITLENNPQIRWHLGLAVGPSLAQSPQLGLIPSAYGNLLLQGDWK
ncbi:hypothetical protein WDW37_11170 [Bdellovibrionota bacterium FG-1]